MMLLVGKMMNFIQDVPQPVQEWDKKVLSMSSLSTDMRWMRKILILSTYFEQILIFLIIHRYAPFKKCFLKINWLFTVSKSSIV
jgi:hypothetical protein